MDGRVRKWPPSRCAVRLGALLVQALRLAVSSRLRLANPPTTFSGARIPHRRAIAPDKSAAACGAAGMPRLRPIGDAGTNTDKRDYIVRFVSMSLPKATRWLRQASVTITAGQPRQPSAPEPITMSPHPFP